MIKSSSIIDKINNNFKEGPIDVLDDQIAEMYFDPTIDEQIFDKQRIDSFVASSAAALFESDDSLSD